jgi:CheY-like chemotaxis protein
MTVVLIVEDEPILRLAAEMKIQEWGFKTVGAGDVEEALSILRSSQPVDVLFTDIYLKTEASGGCEVAREAVKLRPNLHVLYVTGFTLTARIRSMFVEGAGCLGKPYSDADLKEALDRLLARAESAR